MLIKLLSLVAVLQLLSVLVGTKLIEIFKPEDLIKLEFDPLTMFYGNMQIIVILAIIKVTSKYVKELECLN